MTVALRVLIGKWLFFEGNAERGTGVPPVWGSEFFTPCINAISQPPTGLRRDVGDRENEREGKGEGKGEDRFHGRILITYFRNQVRT